MRFRFRVLALSLAAIFVANMGLAAEVADNDVSTLRLLPFPKKVTLRKGTFDLNRPLVLEVPKGHGELAGRLIVEEIKRSRLPAPKVRQVAAFPNSLRLLTNPRTTRSDEPPGFPEKERSPESYWMQVDPDTIQCMGVKPEGMFYAAQTLCQLIRANRRDNSKLPCLRILDWPSLTWRCFQDDMTRGPSSTPATLRREVALGASLKMNLFTYYMEYQYAFKKHPKIGPENGSLEPEDLKALVAFAKKYHIDILGNQQSFGHFKRILQHEEYAGLRENASVLSPVKEGTYKLLDDLYSEVCPLLPFEMFNVCCDETWGLGTGPSKELAAKIGVGGVYVGHIRRVHDLLRDKYKKRMMMWGDIILKHPDKLDQVPKDTVMLTWGYGAKESFEDQIIPFAESGYEFFVCPGISNWSRILPDFGVATTNIHNFVRDGHKHGAIGMLNTAWEDDGEALQGYRWHGFAWGAECAWNASTTTPEDFNRRIGAVLFGETGDHFGSAIELLAQTHRMPGMRGMNNKRFWQDDFKPQGKPAAVRASAERLLGVTGPAIQHLKECKEEATVNADLLDYFLFGARRMNTIAEEMPFGLEAARRYTEAHAAEGATALASLDIAQRLARQMRDRYAELGEEFERLWLAESKPYALDWTTKRYVAKVRRYDQLLARLAGAKKKAAAGAPIPTPKEMGLYLSEKYERRKRPHKILPTPLEPDAAWADPSATHRMGLVVWAGSAERRELPIEFMTLLPPGLNDKPLRAFCHIDGEMPEEILAQVLPIPENPAGWLTMVISGPIPPAGKASVHLYLGLSKPPKSLPSAVCVKEGPNGTKWIENDKVRLLLDPEGGHVYRWEVKALEGRDLTQPGQKDWAGFADAGHGHRNLPHSIHCWGRGPAMARFTCGDDTGLIKIITLFGGASWMEVTLNEPVTYYWDFDNPKNFAADGPTPGEYLFSNGKTGPVGKQADGVEAQVKAAKVHWAIKFNKEKLALGMVTPEVAASFVVAPGAGSGGVGIERSPPVSHFITYAGLLDDEPKEVMETLRRTLDFSNQPEVVLYGVQKK